MPGKPDYLPKELNRPSRERWIIPPTTSRASTVTTRPFRPWSSRTAPRSPTRRWPRFDYDW